MQKIHRPQAQKSQKKNVPLGKIRTDGDTQRREALKREVLDDYVERWRDGAHFPAVQAMYDGEWYWLWDGFYRLESAREAGLDSVEVSFRDGSQLDAQWYSCCANKSHGVRRSPAEKKGSIVYALRHMHGVGLSNYEIGSFVGCSPQTVAKVRAELVQNGDIPNTVYRGGGRIVTSEMEEEWAEKQKYVAQSAPVKKRRPGHARTIKAEDEADEEIVLCDEIGQPVPGDLNVVFEDLFTAMAYARNALRDAQHGVRRALDLIDLHRIMYGPKRVKLEMYINTLTDLIEEGEQQKPYAVCRCASQPPTECQKCSGERWQSKSEHQKSQ